MTESVSSSGKTGEIPLYLRVFAGFGYLLGILGLSLWYKSFKEADDQEMDDWAYRD